jgi:hypothetical protein
MMLDAVTFNTLLRAHARVGPRLWISRTLFKTQVDFKDPFKSW